MEKNEYTKQFMKEIREENTKTVSLTRVVKYMKLDLQASGKDILNHINGSQKSINKNKKEITIR
jgi:hypothetical protein